MSDKNTTAQASQSKRQEERLRRNYILPLSLFVAAFALLYVATLIVPPNSWLWIARIAIIVLASTLPAMIYSYFIQGRGRILFREYRQALRRLGLPEVAQQYQEKFEAVYGPVRFLEQDQAEAAGAETTDRVDIAEINSRPLNSPIVVATLLSFLGWLLVFFPPGVPPDQLAPNPTPLAYGFLGAYVFGLASLVRQYTTDDLQPRYYASLSQRYLTVFALSSLIALALPVRQVADAVDTGRISLGFADQVLLVAFFVGLFPSTGLRLIQRAATFIMGKLKIKAFEEDQPLSLLDGLTVYQEDRLLLEGIENLQNLACVNIVDLMLKTRFSVEQIVDWIDQSLLQMHVTPYTAAFRQSGLRTATDFLDVYKATDTAQRQRLADLIVGHLSTPPALSQTAVLTLFDTLAIALDSDPNIFNVRYWRSHAFEALPDDIERTRISADLQLMQNRAKEAIEIYDGLLRDFPNYPSALLYRGLAHFIREDYEKAIADYSDAIRRGGPQWSNARYAYVERGRALRQIEDYEQAVQNYQDAVNTYANFSEAQLELAYVQSTRLNRHEEAIRNLDAVIAANFKTADALALRGAARFEWWKALDRPANHPVANLIAARDDLQNALRRKPELVQVYINLALILKELGLTGAQEQALTKGLEQMKKTPSIDTEYRLRLDRGYLYFQRERPELAAADFEAAAHLSPVEPAAYIFLSMVYRRTQAWASAQENVLRAAELDPDAPAVQTELLSLSDAALAQGQLDIALTVYTRGAALAKSSNDLIGLGRAQLGLSRLHRRREAWPDARREANNAAQAARTRDDAIYADAMFELGLASYKMGDVAPGIKGLTTSAALYEALGRDRESAQAYYQLALAAPEADARRKAIKKARAKLEALTETLTDDDVKLQAALDELEKTLPRLFGLG